MLNEHVTDLIPGYALGSLDDDDLIRVARHLSGCAVCQSELEAYNQVVDQLAQVAPLRTPPDDLRAKVVGRVVSASQQRALGEQRALNEQQARSPLAQSRADAGAAKPGAPGVNRLGFIDLLRSLFSQPAGWAIAGLALLLLLFLGINNYLLWQRVNNLQARMPAGPGRIVELKGTDNAPMATGYMVVFPNNTYGTLVVSDAPTLDPQHQYQIWLVKDGKRTSGGVFSVNEDGYGTLMIDASQPLDAYQSFGITIEPTGGSPGPTGKKVLGGSL